MRASCPTAGVSSAAADSTRPVPHRRARAALTRGAGAGRVGDSACGLRRHADTVPAGRVMRAAEFATFIKDAKLRAEGVWYDGCRPAHDDHRASLRFCDGETRVVLHCPAW